MSFFTCGSSELDPVYTSDRVDLVYDILNWSFGDTKGGSGDRLIKCAVVNNIGIELYGEMKPDCKISLNELYALIKPGESEILGLIENELSPIQKELDYYFTYYLFFVFLIGILAPVVFVYYTKSLWWAVAYLVLSVSAIYLYKQYVMGQIHQLGKVNLLKDLDLDTLKSFLDKYLTQTRKQNCEL